MRTDTQTKIYLMILKGSTLNELISSTNRNGLFIRGVISNLKSYDIKITFNNNIYKVEV
jgi:hypothetical protein